MGNTSFMKTVFSPTYIFAITIIGVAILCFTLFTPNVFAQSPSVELLVCSPIDGCGNDVSSLTGEEIQLVWEVTGNLSNCQLFVNTTLLQTIDTSMLPGGIAAGTLNYILPEGSSDFSLDCQGSVSGAEIDRKSVV